MFADKKQFVVVYDKDCKEFAETLMTLASNDEKLRGIKREAKEFNKDSSIVSDENVIIIGKKASDSYIQNFSDNYNNFGIHIGYYGAKAWIVCDNIQWNENKLSEFHKEVISIREKLGMSTNGVIKQNKELLDEKATEKALIGGGAFDVFVLPAILADPITDLMVAAPTIKKLIDFVNYRSNFKKQQYNYAIALFCSSYIHDFLKTKEENNEEQNEEQNF